MIHGISIDASLLGSVTSSMRRDLHQAHNHYSGLYGYNDRDSLE